MANAERKVSESDVAWVAVGSSGVGKSSLIGLFCDEDVKTSGSSDSCSKSIKEYESKAKFGNFPLIDTIGFEDTDNIKSEEITVSLLRFIHSRKLTNVKVLWLMNKQIKKTPELQRQANFINSFGKDIWKSIIIILKSVHPTEKIMNKYSQGAIAAINENGINKNDINNITKLSYTCWDWLTNDEKEEEYCDLTNEQKLKRNILSIDKVSSLIYDNMIDLKSCKVIFSNNKCKKCGQIGDFRLLSPKCHFKSEKYHPNEGEYIHNSNNTLLKHKNESIPKHRGKLQTIKSHAKDAIHEKVFNYNTEWYHDKGTRHVHTGRWENQRGGRVVSGIFSFGISEVASWGYWTCCEVKHRNVQGCREEWACCSRSVYASGCTSRQNKIFSHYKYSCCDRRIGTEGCGATLKYDCCNGGSDSKECDLFYTCCNTFINDGNAGIGCTQYHSCCNELVNDDNNGCVLKCCKEKKNDNNNSNTGCKERCIKCKKPWNDENFIGCGIGDDYKHDIIQL